MKKRHLISQGRIALCTMMACCIAFGSCSDDKNDGPVLPSYDGTQPFHLGIGIGYSGSAQGAVLPLSADNLRDTTQTYDFTKGYTLEPARTHRFYSGQEGKFLYNLEYGNGNIVKYQPTGGSGLYAKLKEINVKEIIGTANPRWRVVNDNLGLVYNVVVTDVKDSANNFIRKRAVVDILPVHLEDLSLGEKKSVELPQETDYTEIPNLTIWRIDQPILHNGKIYFGVAKRGYDNTGKALQAQQLVQINEYPSSTLVLDYPSLDNPKIINSTLGTGETYGYRSPSYFEYNGDVYHVNRAKSRVFKITNGEYDNSYDFDIAKALGVDSIGGTGIFYASQGIAYLPFFDMAKGSRYTEAAWGIARVDLNNKTAIKMNMPSDLWLFYYQNAKVGADGKLYMAICPMKESGNIYIFDPNKADANGFEKGAKLTVAGEGFYLGIF